MRGTREILLTLEALGKIFGVKLEKQGNLQTGLENTRGFQSIRKRKKAVESGQDNLTYIWKGV